MLPEDIDYHDVRSWLQNTYFLVERSDARRLCRYVTLSEDHEDHGDDAQVHAVDVAHGDPTEVELTDVRLWWPMMGFVNVPGRPAPLYVQRRTARQWRRSFYTGNGQIEARVACYSRLSDCRRVAVGREADDLALALFKSEYPATLEAAREIISGDEADGVALSRNCLISSAYGDHPAVIWRQPECLVGYLDRDNRLNPGTSGTSLYYRRAARFLATRLGGAE